VRNPILTIAKSSSQTAGSPYHLFGFGMDPPERFGLLLDFDCVLEDRIVAVPLGEVLTAHEGAVLGRAPVVVPQIEVEEIDRLREERTGDDLVGAERLVDFLGGFYLIVGGGDGGLGL